MSNKKNIVKFELSGGIGNQLFQYSAGKYYEARCKFDVVFSEGVTKHSHRKWDRPISKLFKHESINLGESLISRPMSVLKRLDRKLVKHIGLYSKFRQIYLAQEIGYIQEEPDFNEYKIISGYFQSYLYAEHSRESIVKNLNGLTTSCWTREKITEAESIKPIAVHVRRGDYVNQSNRYGLLGEEYYLEALSRLITSIGDRTIWIFSDGHDHVLESRIREKYRTVVINKPSDTDDLEVLLIMSKCFAHVIANSTFSWWAAFLSDSSQQVYAPRPWTVSRINPGSLIPPHWKTINSGLITKL